jgi:hypothetical protein
MSVTPEELKTYVEIAKPFVEPLISTVLKPQLAKLSKWLKTRETDNKVIDNYFEDKFTNYLSRTYRTSSIVNTLVFPNQQINIKDIYFPLQLVSTKDHKQYIIANNKIDELLSKNKRILISDTGGMGKSTLMKWISLNLIEYPSTIPILIELRKLNTSHKILDEIFELIDPIDKSFDKDLIIRFLELGFFTIILDGFDEIPKDIQEKVTVELRDFINKVPENNFVLTSRPESALSSFGDFQMFYIRPLNPNESYQIIKKYDAINNITQADNLIEEIKTRLEQVKEFLTNPFLVSLLYKSYTYNKDLPSKKTTFYEEVYTSLFKHHDSSKDGYKRLKLSKLDILDFRIILRHIAFETAKLGKVIYTELELLTFITNSKIKSVNIDFKESDYLDDLLSTVPLFARDGSQIKWAHKSIQDYFAAEYITFYSKKEEMLKRIYASKKDNYLNILDLTYELEPKLFRKIIMLPVLKDFVKFYDSSYLLFTSIPKERINDRKVRTFGRNYCIVNPSSKTDFTEAEELFKGAMKKENCDFINGATQIGENIFILGSIDFSVRILKILSLKNENIFDTKNDNYSKFKNLLLIPKDTAFLVNDDPKSILNQDKTFLETNNLLLRHFGGRFNNSSLSYKNVKVAIKRIEKEIEIDESDKDLDDI